MAGPESAPCLERPVLGRQDRDIDGSGRTVELDVGQPSLKGDANMSAAPRAQQVGRLGLRDRSKKDERGASRPNRLHRDRPRAWRLARMTFSALAAIGRSVGLSPDLA